MKLEEINILCADCGEPMRAHPCPAAKNGEHKSERRAVSALASSTGSLPRGPWIASNQYGMHMVLSQDNEIILRADAVPFETLRAMVTAANEQLAANDRTHGQNPAKPHSL